MIIGAEESACPHTLAELTGRQHKSEGRQMIPHQKLHKSILRRLEYERRAKVADAYIPAADIPEAWPTWKQLKADTQALPNEFLEE